MKTLFAGPRGRYITGGVFVIAGLVMLPTFVGIMFLVCGAIFIGQGAGIVPMRRDRP